MDHANLLLNFAAILLLFCVLQLFSIKNAENEDFDQHLGCTAPKRWPKYTTLHNIFYSPFYYLK